MSYPYVRQPRPEQLRAIKEIYRSKHVLIIGDMGVGKTKIGVDFIGNMVWHKKISRALVVAPLEAIDVWIDEIKTNCPFLTFSLLLKGETVNWDANIILVNYDYLSPRRKKKPPTARALKKAALTDTKPKRKAYVDKRVIRLLIAWSPSVVIIDEGHKIKRPSARRSKAIHELGPIAEYTVDLTGTPSGNKKVMDLWSQFRFIKHDLLDEEYNDHKHRYGLWGGFGGFQLLKTRNVKKFAKIVAPHTIRIKKTGLPEQNFIRHPVKLPEEARAIYKQMEEEFVAYVEGEVVIASIALTKMMKLSQIAGGFIKNEKKENLPVHRAKLNAIQEILEDLKEAGTIRVVIYARFLWELAEIRKILEAQEWPNIHRVKGRVIQEILNKFNTEGGVMLCQTQSGAGSNNFQSANYCIFYSTDYSYINFHQALGRIHRIGQTKPCFYYFLQVRGTIDNRIYQILMENKDAAEELKILVEEIKNDLRN